MSYKQETSNKLQETRNRKFNYLFLCLILLLGFWLRFWNVESNPVSLYWDEASIGYEAYSVAQTGKDMHGNHWFQAIYPAYGDYKAPVYIWLTALAHIFMPAGLLAVRITSIVAGTLTILIVYLLYRELFRKTKYSHKIGLFCALMMALLPWHIHFSRTGFEANLGLFFVLTALYFLVKARIKGTMILPAVIFGLLGIYTYFSIRIVWPMMFFGAIVLYGKDFLPKWKWIILGLGIGLAAYIPMVKSPYYEAANVFRLGASSILQNEPEILYANDLRFVDNFTIFSRLVHHRNVYTLKKLVENYSDHLDFSYLFLNGDSNIRHGSGITGLMLVSFIPIFFFGLVYLSRQKQILALLLVWWIVALLPASVPEDTPHALRSLNGIIPLVGVLGIGLNSLFIYLNKTYKRKIILGVYSGIILINFGFYSVYYQLEYPRISSRDWQDGYIQLADYVNNNYELYDEIKIVNLNILYIYYLYFGQVDPSTTQNVFSKLTPGQYYLDKIDNLSFERISWLPSKSANGKRVLLVDLIENIPSHIPVQDWIYDSLGRKMFGVFELENL